MLGANEVSTFSRDEYILNVDWSCWQLSPFDTYLQEAWLKRRKLFRYDLKIDNWKFLEGKHRFLAQLNVNRAVNRRVPDEFADLRQPFSHDNFNFTKMNKEEIMFCLSEKGKLLERENERNYFAINVSPLEEFHSLLLPSLYQCFNQTVRLESIRLVLNTILISGSPELRIGFNSLCGHASLNHLHFHAYYLKIPMALESISVEHLSGRCHTIESYPSKGFVFQLKAPDDIEEIINDVYTLTNFLLDKNIAHNMYFTRGLSFEQAKTNINSTRRDCIRIYVWARTSSTGAKILDAFNPAMCELFGHILVKTQDCYDNLNEDYFTKMLDSITSEPFYSVKEEVKCLFQNKIYVV